MIEPAGSAPWVVQFQTLSGGPTCHGTLISPGWILTAGHCVDPGTPGQPASGAVTWAGNNSMRARAIDGQAIEFARSDVKMAPGYTANAQTATRDLALVRLPSLMLLGPTVMPAQPVAEARQVGWLGDVATLQMESGVATAPGTVAVGTLQVTELLTVDKFRTAAVVGQTVEGDSGSGLIRNRAINPEVFGVLSGGSSLTPSVDKWTDVHDVDPNTGALGEANQDWVPWIAQSLRAARRPNTTLTYPVTTCRTAPARVTPNAARRRADLAEVFPEYITDYAGIVTTKTSIAQHPSTGASFNVFEEWMRTAGGASADIRWSAGDFDRDGDQDLMAVWRYGNDNRVTLWRSTGGSFVPTEWGAPPAMGGWVSTAQWIPGDFDNDGRTDLVSAWNDGGATTLSLFLSRGDRFDGFYQAGLRDGTWAANTKFMVGDFTGDGADDILTAERSVVGTSVGTKLMLRGSSIDPATGRRAFLAQTVWMGHHGGWDDAMAWLAGNFDGAGKADVMAIWNDGGAATFTVYPSNGSLPSGYSHWRIREGVWSPTHRWTAGDVDADGRADVIAAWNDAGFASLVVRRSNGAGLDPQATWGDKRVAWQPATAWCAGTFDGT